MYIIENNEYKNIEKTICPDCGVLYSYEHRLFHKHKGRQTEYIINIKCILNNTTNIITLKVVNLKIIKIKEALGIKLNKNIDNIKFIQNCKILNDDVLVNKNTFLFCVLKK